MLLIRKAVTLYRSGALSQWKIRASLPKTGPTSLASRLPGKRRALEIAREGDRRKR
jgi:hypothetical protein